MKRGSRVLLWAAALALVMCCLQVSVPVGAAGAEESALQAEHEPLMTIWAGEETVAGVKNGKKLPVYAAPFDGAWRGSKGRAAFSTKEAFRFLGTAQNGEWVWIEYDIDGRSRRIGWVRADQLAGSFDRECFPADGALLRITGDTFMTDDPRGGKRVIKTLKAGEEVIGLGTLEGSLPSFAGWICAETEIDGKPAWGFLPSDAAEKVPSYTVEDGTVVYREGITIIGNDGMVPGPPDEDGYPTTVWRTFSPGELKGSSLYIDLFYDTEEAFDGEGGTGTLRADRIVYPSTLKMLGSEAVFSGNWKEIRMPENLEFCDDYALYAVRVDRLVFPRGYRGPVSPDEDCLIGAFEVEEGNAVYRSVDGVLYSADGKTLLRYPSGRTAEHFDVPAGVETIGDGAFNDGSMGIPLKTISLPLGLKKIGAYAFSGCGRLLSLTVPLTVTEIDEKAFAQCVSLERLSLPEGLWKDYEIGFATPGDFTHYNGDNGETLAAPREDF